MIRYIKFKPKSGLLVKRGGMMGFLHISMTKGDFVFAQWDDDGCEKFNRKIHELRMQGYRKINQYHDYLNFYQEYRKGNSKKRITVTLMCC